MVIAPTSTRSVIAKLTRWVTPNLDLTGGKVSGIPLFDIQPFLQ